MFGTNTNPLPHAFFLTPAAAKAKTHAKNSRKKLNLWEDFPSKLENSRKKLRFLLKTKDIQRGGTFYAIFIANFFSNKWKLESLLQKIKGY